MRVLLCGKGWLNAGSQVMDVSCSYPPRYFLRVLFVDFNQKIIDLKGTFEHVWDNELGEAYLFTNCELYKQYYIRPGFDDEDIEEDDFEIPAKLNRAQFEALSSEYCYLDRKIMFPTNEMTEEEESKYFELKDLLFADITIG